MILGDPAQASAQAPRGQIRVSIDEMFRRLAERRPDALALADPPNRKNFTDGAPRRLTYAEADRMVAAIAGRLRRMGLPVDAVIGVQMPNIVENILAMLGVLRAGMVVAPLPLLWRRADAVAALARVGAKALISCGRVGDFKHGQFGMRVAAEVFAIRYVCGFGANLPDGVVPFDDLFTADKLDPIPPLERERQANAAAHLAAITFDVSEGGLVPVARNHSELVAAALVVLLESHLAQNANILSTLAPSSFAGLSLTLLPWLLTGGMLSLHHPFDADVLARQRRDDRCPTLILPGPVASRMAEAGALAGEGQTAVIAAWRGPNGLAMSPTWRAARTALIDVAVFGEIGLLAGRRGADGRPVPIQFGPVVAPRGSPGGIVLAELLPTAAGTVSFRGPMAPQHTFPPGADRSGLPHLKVERSGVVDTGYAFRIDSSTHAVVITGPPSGIASVGGYRFPLHDLKEIAGRVDGDATIAALPDPLVGQRLIGNAADRNMMQAALGAVGVNPLVVAAFRDRSERDSASAERRE
jgi:AMP-binding enzyme